MSLQLKNNQNKINLSHLKDEEILKILLHLYDNKKFEEVIRLADRVKRNTSVTPPENQGFINQNQMGE